MVDPSLMFSMVVPHWLIHTERKNKAPKGAAGTISAYKRLMDKLNKQRDAHRTWGTLMIMIITRGSP